MSPRPLALLFAAVLSVSLTAQQTCPPPPLEQLTRGRNIFSPQQEMDLGDAMAAEMRRNARVVEDPALNRPLQQLGDRLLAQLPDTGMRFQFALIDQPITNAYSIAGGRIYVSKKLVTFARTEEELASVLAHEIGHSVTHQAAIEMSHRLHDWLHVDSVGDRQDIFDRLNQLLTIQRERHLRASQHEEQNQMVADRVAVYVLARAGYSPQVFIDFFQRLTETTGKTSNWLSDFFGATDPDVKRMREAARDLKSMPPACIQLPAQSADADFNKWQSQLIESYGVASHEQLSGLLSKQKLNPPLLTDFSRLKFSPDGKYLLAQDDTGIDVLSVPALQMLFRIDNADSLSPQFTPDSSNIVFHTLDERVERWDIQMRKRSITDLALPKGCWQEALSPDGKTYSCFNDDSELRLLDVASGRLLAVTKKFANIPQGFLFQLMISPDAVELLAPRMHFSADGRYFVASRGYDIFTYDTVTGTEIPLGGHTRDLLHFPWSFVGANEIAGYHDIHRKLDIAEFPSGKILEQHQVSYLNFSVPSRGHYLIVFPLQAAPTGILDLSTDKVLGSQSAALDCYNDLFASESVDGSILLHRYTAAGGASPSKAVPVARFTSEDAPLGHLTAASVSPDFALLAVSEKTRGAVWDLASNKRLLFLRGFRGVWFEGSSTMYGDFPARERDRLAHSLGRFEFPFLNASRIEDFEKDSLIDQYGPVYVRTVTRPKLSNLEVHDVRDGKLLWTREFDGFFPPRLAADDEARLLFHWDARDSAARNIIKSDPRLKDEWSAIKDKEAAELAQVFNASDGRLLTSVVIERARPLFRFFLFDLQQRTRPSDLHLVGSYLLAPERPNRVLVYSLQSGKQVANWFGSPIMGCSGAGIAGLLNTPEHLQLYDLTALKPRGSELAFPDPIRLAQCSQDGKRLLVVTTSQTTYLFDLNAI